MMDSIGFTCASNAVTRQASYPFFLPFSLSSKHQSPQGILSFVRVFLKRQSVFFKKRYEKWVVMTSAITLLFLLTKEVEMCAGSKNTPNNPMG
ncbi:hypothetical protein QM999_04345 [Pectobacterium cacticida]|uniref:hypothetical protein n=1 Tax=Pectobacterium cacticida TaxID=69221 RepID=UPI002FF22E93